MRQYDRGDQRRQAGEYPDVPDVGQEVADEPAARQKADVETGQGQSRFQVGEALNG